MHADDILAFINYLAISAFAVLRSYAIWGHNWKLLPFLIPLALVKPAILMVSNRHTFCLCSGLVRDQ